MAIVGSVLERLEAAKKGGRWGLNGGVNGGSVVSLSGNGSGAASVGTNAGGSLLPEIGGGGILIIGWVFNLDAEIEWASIRIKLCNSK